MPQLLLESRCNVSVIWNRSRFLEAHFHEKIALAVSVLAISAVSASAADMAPAPVYTKAPVVPVALYDWTGFYIGLNGGYSWGNSSNTFSVPLPVLATSASDHMNGWVFGGQAGYNWQFNRSWVFGIEGDIDATGQDGSATLDPRTTVTRSTPTGFFVNAPPVITTTTTTSGTFEDKLPWLGTFRGRIGVLPTDRVLLYVTGGLAVGEVKSTSSVATTTSSVSSFGGTTGPTTVTALGTASSTHVGWTIGGGVEGAIGGNWTAKLEYLYVDLGTVNNTFTGVGAFAPLAISSRVTDNVLRVGVNYRFGGPVVATY
jgi:outer membrane immunogenic protein